MENTILNPIPFDLDVQALKKRLRIKPDSSYARQFENLLEDARQVARLKAAYRVVFIDERNDNSVVIEGITFSSRVLAVNLEKVHRVFPYLATCGEELDQWSKSFSDMLEQFWADAIKETAVHVAYQALIHHLADTYELVHSSVMNPGSLEDWPITEQKQLFRLLEKEKGVIGVNLTDSFLMIPTKSVSGICFPTEHSFVNCQLCPREGCPGRRARYEQNLYEQKFRLKDEVAKS
jgi:hypothetical protein